MCRVSWQNTEEPTLGTVKKILSIKERVLGSISVKSYYLRKTRTDDAIWPGQGAVDYCPLHDLATGGRCLTPEEGPDNIWAVNTKSLSKVIPEYQQGWPLFCNSDLDGMEIIYIYGIRQRTNKLKWKDKKLFMQEGSRRLRDACLNSA